MNRCTPHHHAYSCNRTERDALYRFAVARVSLYLAAVHRFEEDADAGLAEWSAGHQARIEARRLASTLGTLKLPLDQVAEWYAEQTTAKAAHRLLGAVGFTDSEEAEWHRARRNTFEWKWWPRCAAKGTSFWCATPEWHTPQWKHWLVRCRAA
jgi:hypothetical protein